MAELKISPIIIILIFIIFVVLISTMTGNYKVKYNTNKEDMILYHLKKLYRKTNYNDNRINIIGKYSGMNRLGMIKLYQLGKYTKDYMDNDNKRYIKHSKDHSKWFPKLK